MLILTCSRYYVIVRKGTFFHSSSLLVFNEFCDRDQLVVINAVIQSQVFCCENV